MRLAAIWLNKHHLFNTTTINLGGQHIYKFEFEAKNDTNSPTVVISRTKNEVFISNFYSEGKITLMSAIVGNNGSGKSSILHTIRKILKSNRGFGGFLDEYQDAILIFEDPEGNFFTSRDYYGNGLAYDTKRNLDIKYRGVNISFEEIKEDEFKDYKSHVETVYYSPYLDFQNFFLESTPDINISLDYLIKNDIQKYPDRAATNLVIGHRSQNILRIINFQTSDIGKTINKKLNLPTFDTIEVFIDVPEFNVNQFHNTPWEFRPVYEKLYELWKQEINASERRITDDNEENIKILKLWFLYGFLNTVFTTFEKTNHHLREGVVDFDLRELDDKDFHEAIFLFLDKTNITNIRGWKVFAKISKELLHYGLFIIEELHRKDISDTKRFSTNFQDLERLLAFETNFLIYLENTFNVPTSFLDFSFGDALSSGEKSFLDLLSRLFSTLDKVSAKKKKRTEELIDEEEEVKSHLIILLDEGDSGFHPTWKKKYVNTLITALPEIFKDLDITIQVIFTTHDALTLSDIPNHNIVYLKRDKEEFKVLERDNTARPQKSFGANISNLLGNSFFIEDGLVGEFAVKKIDKTIKWLRKGQNTKEKREHHKKIIKMIDEPLIMQKLAEMYSGKTGEGLFQKQIIQEQINALRNKLENL